MAALLLLGAILLVPHAAAEVLGSSRMASDLALAASLDDGDSPIRKVVTLLEDMKSTCERDAKEDLAAYDKYMCWCDTNRKEKTAAIENAQNRLGELSAFLEESAAKEGELKTEISVLEEDIAADHDALDTATGVRNKENDAFTAESEDMKETIGLLGQAIEVLSKVQFLQNHKGKSDQAKVATSALLQVKHIVERRFPQFQGVMQKDLFDVLDSLSGVAQSEQGLQQKQRRSAVTTGAFLGEVFMPKRDAAALEQNGKWDGVGEEKTVEQIGKEAKPNSESGAASGSKSYNSRSGGILGTLTAMSDEFKKNLFAAQKEEHESEVTFQHLRAAKLAEIAAATNQKKEKEAVLADTLDKAAKAREEQAALEDALTADQQFMMTLETNCEREDNDYQGRVKIRNDELQALGEALKILTADDARDLFAKTISFVQVDSVTAADSAERLAMQDRAAEKAMKRIAGVARKHGNWALVSLAVRVELDAFTKVKAMMDKMMAELQKQQKEEYAKWEVCKKDIDQTEDSIKVGEVTKKDLNSKHQDLTNTLALLDEEITGLKKEVEDMEVSLKQAGEERKAGNQLFQQTMMDQRATINILNKVQERLHAFYNTKTELIQTRTVQVPGAAAPPPPPEPADYQKSAGAGGVLQVLAKIIADAEGEEKALAVSEQNAQENYAKFVQETTASIEGSRKMIEQKEVHTAEANSEKSATEEAQLANDAELGRLGDLLKAHHMDCDYVLKYFDIRQKARQEEMDAITDAKAILSGANFGK